MIVFEFVDDEEEIEGVLISVRSGRWRKARPRMSVAIPIRSLTKD